MALAPLSFFVLRPSAVAAGAAGLRAARYRCSTGSPRRDRDTAQAFDAAHHPALVARRRPGGLGEHGYRAAHSPARP
ncbi:hypothetical protein, partial [Piscinibacter sp.]|uniref:hypothetical protein n=1 Tax=Piscinibacter sp. TaxID=1903157 RepID=UPI0035B0AEDD